MERLLCAACAFLLGVIAVLLIKIFSLHRAADQIGREFGERLDTDTNVGIDIRTADKHMRRLAAQLDCQLKILRKAQIRYRLGDHELKESVAGISHDLRTPLTAIMGYLELLKREPLSDAARGYADIIENRANALKHLTEELFCYSLAVMAEQYEQRENVNINQVLEESVAALYAAMNERGICPRILMPTVRIERRLNRAALLRIFENVLGNAVKYSSGDLTVELTDQGVITFTNRADGMDEVAAGRLFDRFYTVKAGSHSTGLGLSIAKTLTEQMGGQIKAVWQDQHLTVILKL